MDRTKPSTATARKGANAEHLAERKEQRRKAEVMLHHLQEQLEAEARDLARHQARVEHVELAIEAAKDALAVCEQAVEELERAEGSLQRDRRIVKDIENVTAPVPLLGEQFRLRMEGR
jgi:chromosome segregation ATPase